MKPLWGYASLTILMLPVIIESSLLKIALAVENFVLALMDTTNGILFTKIMLNLIVKEWNLSPIIGGIMVDQDNQGQWGQTYSLTVRSVFVYQRVQITGFWKKEVFGYLDHTLLICEMMYPSTSRSG